MRNSIWTPVLLIISCAVALGAGEAKALDLAAQPERQGYSIGYQLGADFRAKKIQVNPDALSAGLKAGLEGVEPAIEKEQMHSVLSDLQKQVEEDRKVQLKKIADDNRLAGEKFLAENSGKDGVVALPSGLQYKVVQAGDGPRPDATSKVTVNYRGSLPDGTEFDSSYQRGQPATFPVNRVISGWTEAMQLMPVGSKWLLYVPGALAYGERGAPPKIGSNQLLLFEVELLSFE